MKKYTFKEYSNEYPILFQQEKQKLKKILGNDGNIEHIGSTSIPNLGGKGIIDIAIGINKSNFNKTKKLLEQNNYEFREKASYPDRLFFRIDYNERRVHIHLVEFNNTEWNNVINFRNYLLKHPSKIKEYIQIKKEAVEIAHNSGVLYRKHKNVFIQNILSNTNKKI